MSGPNSNNLIFAGPTLYGTGAGAAASACGFRLLPPAQRGDVERAVAAHLPGILVVVDGVFHQHLAVGHAEIRTALSEGWEVWGLSSMGAIRAYEMRHMGMRGYGQVYRCFFEHEDFRDDEVALVHEPDPPYRALSEPLVHIRFWLTELRGAGLLGEAREREVLDCLMSMWYCDRTLESARSMVLDLIPEHNRAVEATLSEFGRFRVKCLDLSDFLREQPWRRTCSRARAAREVRGG
jgi:hypothetical protein